MHCNTHAHPAVRQLGTNQSTHGCDRTPVHYSHNPPHTQLIFLFTHTLTPLQVSSQVVEMGTNKPIYNFDQPIDTQGNVERDIKAMRAAGITTGSAAYGPPVGSFQSDIYGAGPYASLPAAWFNRASGSGQRTDTLSGIGGTYRASGSGSRSDTLSGTTVFPRRSGSGQRDPFI